jgi:hypothetical protein
MDTVRDVIRFPVVGIKFVEDPVAAAEFLAVAATCAGRVLLVESEEPSDPMAVRIVADAPSAVHCGWAPQRGWSCANCWRAVPISDNHCRWCYSANLVEGGLARRLRERGVIDDGMYLATIEPREVGSSYQYNVRVQLLGDL